MAPIARGEGVIRATGRPVMVGEIPWRGPGGTDCRAEAVAPLASPRRESTMAGPLTAVMGPRWEASGVHRHGELGRDPPSRPRRRPEQARRLPRVRHPLGHAPEGPRPRRAARLPPHGPAAPAQARAV